MNVSNVRTHVHLDSSAHLSAETHLYAETHLDAVSNGERDKDPLPRGKELIKVGAH